MDHAMQMCGGNGAALMVRAVGRRGRVATAQSRAVRNALRRARRAARAASAVGMST